MYKKDLVRKANEVLRNNGIKKPISIPKQMFYISDDDGTSRAFSVKRRDKTAVYTVDDVTNIIDACICVIEDALKNGETISIRGFGAFSLRYIKPRQTKNVNDGQEILIPGHYVPKFAAGHDLKMCAKTYELLLEDKMSAYNPECHERDDAEGGE